MIRIALITLLLLTTACSNEVFETKIIVCKSDKGEIVWQSNRGNVVYSEGSAIIEHNLKTGSVSRYYPKPGDRCESTTINDLGSQ